MRIGAIVCFVFAALSGLSGVINIAFAALSMMQPEGGMPFDVFLPRAVGTLLLPMILLIGGLVLWKKAGGSRSRERP